MKAKQMSSESIEHFNNNSNLTVMQGLRELHTAHERQTNY